MNVAANIAGLKSLSTSKKLNIARGFFGALAGVLFLSTLITFGGNMDYANFPGSNMVFQTEGEGDLEGEFTMLNRGQGYAVDIKNVVSNIRCVAGNSCDYGMGVEDDVIKPLEILDSDGNAGGTARGWTIVPPCAKTDKVSDCAPFGVDAPLSGLGQAFFGVLAINAVLYSAHTGVELGKPKFAELMSKDNVLIGLNVAWGILSFSLFVWSAVAWRGLCDKIDTGLGRGVDDVPGCASTYCTISYGGFFASFAVALLVYRIPDMLVMFGVLGLERADGRQRVYDDDDDL